MPVKKFVRLCVASDLDQKVHTTFTIDARSVCITSQNRRYSNDPEFTDFTTHIARREEFFFTWVHWVFLAMHAYLLRRHWVPKALVLSFSSPSHKCGEVLSDMVCPLSYIKSLRVVLCLLINFEVVDVAM